MEVILLGSSGLIGNFVLQKLIANPQIKKIHTLVRKSNPIMHTKVQEHIMNTQDLTKHLPNLDSSTILINCIGSTIKKAGSPQAFEQIDFHIPIEIIKKYQKHLLKIISVSVLGANIESKVFYNRIKDKLEIEIEKLNITESFFIRPSLLIGDRPNEFRPGEYLAQKISPFLNFFIPKHLSKYKAVKAESVADLILDICINQNPINTEIEFILVKKPRTKHQSISFKL